MNKQFKKFACIVGIVGTVLIVSHTNAQSQESRGEFSYSKEKMREKWKARRVEMHKQLGLTTEQEEKLKAHRSRHREGKRKLFENIKSKRIAMAAELQKQEINMDKIHQLHNELKAIKMQKEDQRLEGILGVRNILTPEQFTKFMKFKKTRWEKHHEGKGSHGSHGFLGGSGS